MSDDMLARAIWVVVTINTTLLVAGLALDIREMRRAKRFLDELDRKDRQ